MGLFGSLFTGVSALFAQSQNTAIISNNIANVGTTGYKRSEASFNSLVTTESRLSTFSPGTVTVNRLQRIDQQGSIQQTRSSTDAAISGNGFFPVKRSTDTGQEFLYTRAGNFSEDSQGLLRNASGFILYAWPIDTNGDLPANQGDLTSLVPTDVAFLGGLTRPTTAAEIAVNLDADQASINNDIFIIPSVLPIPRTQPAAFSRGLTVFDSLGSPQTLTFEYRKIIGPMANATAGTTGLSLSDSVALTDATSGFFSGVINNNETFAIEVNTTDPATGNGITTTETFEFVDTIGTAGAGNNEVLTAQDLINAINAFGTGNELTASLDTGGRLVVVANAPSATIKFTDGVGTPLADGFSLITDVQGVKEHSTAYYATAATLLDTAADVPTAAAQTVTVTVNGTAYTTAAFNTGATDVTTYLGLLAAADDGGGNLLGTVMDVSYVNGRIEYEALSANSTITVTSATTAGMASGDNGLGISGSGFVYEPEAPITPTAGGGTAYSTNDPFPDQDNFPAFQNVSTPNTQGWWQLDILLPNGSALTSGLLNFDGNGSLNASADSEGEIDIELNNIDFGNGSNLQSIEVDVSRFSQFAGNFDIIFSDQNGAELGLRTGVEITRDGVIVARFSNGASSDLYKIPLVTFANANGLQEVSGTAYTESEDSGEENLREAGQGGAGFVEPSTLEASNVDLADEFARLIISQRAFGAATRTINTVDQMTQDLLSLRG